MISIINIIQIKCDLQSFDEDRLRLNYSETLFVIDDHFQIRSKIWKKKLSTRKHSSRMYTTCQPYELRSPDRGVGPEMNMFGQDFSDGHQISLSEGTQAWSLGRSHVFWCQVDLGGGGFTIRSNASWVMVTCGFPVGGGGGEIWLFVAFY